MADDFTVLIMAAGKGTRMRSSLPKVLHPLCGRPMVEWVIAAAREAGAGEVVCITRPGDGVADGLPDDVTIAEQVEGEGTGAAILACREAAAGAGTVVILSGDHPLVSPELITGLLATHHAEDAAATLLTTEELDPTGYGRVVRSHSGAVERIVETKHVDGVPGAELAIREINIGTYAVEGAQLFDALERIGEERGERYLTGIVPALIGAGEHVAAHRTANVRSAMGVNSRADLMDLEELAQRDIIRRHAENGVTIESPASVRIEVDVEIGQDTVLGPATTLNGRTTIGSGGLIGPATTIVDSALGDDVTCLHAFLVQARVDDRASVGPFAYLRPGAHIGAGAKIGTYVEIKNSEIGPGAKVPHLSYLGDADVGAGANVAAGNITANYDGFAKHRTTIEAGAKTGVNASYIAPVTVGEGAYIGAGSVITEDVPAGALGISRPEQKNIEGYAERVEKERG
jgi:bifunctional UDP-N-acetylglucosamine pyrophosphorylase/glucosamine-1-phosphate N-acetyltransferase